MPKKEDLPDIPQQIYDSNTKITYGKGKFLGRGGFASCYELITGNERATLAGKVISKTLMTKQHQRDKITQEIQIHKQLKHKNIVGFYSFFEDSANIYIVLELCKYKSMMELHKRRKAITEPETRFYMKEILSGVSYLHSNKIIHRDLKLGNLFLSDGMHVKIGDFGLATRIEYNGEKKKTLCGTPNYIAPEILTKKGHSFEVDVWSIGCIMYTLLIGKPPFETNSLRETYVRIKKCEYRFVKTIPPEAKAMIVLMIQPDPKLRPKVDELLTHKFMLNGYCPQVLPISCLTMAPRFDQVSDYRKPLIEINNKQDGVLTPNKVNVDYIAAGGRANTPPSTISHFDAGQNFRDLRSMLHNVLKTKPARNQKFGDEMSDPSAQPMIWVSKWVDYSDKYGFGYQLSDEGVGVMFNDTTKLIMLSNGINVHYIDAKGVETYMTVDNYPAQYEKKMKLLSYFNRYMREHLIKAGASEARESDSLSRIPHLYQWCRSASGVLMQLNNGTVQMNFQDHTKIIMCPLMGAITYIDEDKSFRTFRFSTIQANGCSVGLYEKMRYAYDRIGLLCENEALA